MFCHACKEQNGIRFWLHFSGRSCIAVEFYWWKASFGLAFGPDDEGWNASFRAPPLALYLSIEGMGLWQPRKKCIATWDGNREFWIPDSREFSVSVSDWSIRLGIWERWGEWRKADPWWIRGVHIDLRDLVLGRQKCKTEELAAGIPCQVPMPEGIYHAIAKIERRTWKRKRWLSHSRTSAWLDIPKGIPHAGKGENSWDCGDDGLFGIGGDTIEDAVKRARESVLESRRKYGSASQEAMKAARA
jgi:hypothetical protein